MRRVFVANAADAVNQEKCYVQIATKIAARDRRIEEKREFAFSVGGSWNLGIKPAEPASTKL
jgi:hypothetical protein